MRRNTAVTAVSAPSAQLRSERDDSGALRLILSGHLDVDSTGGLWRAATAAARDAGHGALVVDATGLDYCDTAGAALLVAIEREQRAAGGAFSIEGLRDEFSQVVAMLRPSESATSAKSDEPVAFLARLGRSALGITTDLRALVAFVGELTVFTLRTARHPSELRFRDAVTVADRAGLGAVPIVALVGFLLGLILAFQGAIPMQRFGAQIFVADLLGISMLRELGPLMAAILLTARSGSAFAAEIGTMKVNEEIDALSTMGLEPVRFLVVPRVLDRQPPEKQRFALAPGRPDPVSGPRAGALRVGVVRVSSPFANCGFVRRSGEKTFASAFYNEFAAPPGTLLRDVLVSWFREGTHFTTVVRGSEAPPDWLLEVDLEALYADLRDAAAPQATIAFAMRLLDAHAAPAAIVFENHYAATEPAADGSPPALVAAWNRALARLLAELAADLDGARGQAYATRGRGR